MRVSLKVTLNMRRDRPEPAEVEWEDLGESVTLTELDYFDPESDAEMDMRTGVGFRHSPHSNRKAGDTHGQTK